MWSITALACLWVYLYWIMHILILLIDGLFKYEKGLFLQGDKKHSKDHIAITFWLLISSISLLMWLFWQNSFVYVWNSILIEQNLMFTFLFNWLVYISIIYHFTNETYESKKTNE